MLVWRTDDEGAEHRAELKTKDGERVTRVRIGRSDTAVAATEKGNLYHWELLPEVRLTEVAHVSEEEVTALEYVLGNITLIVGRRARATSRAGSGCGRRKTTPTRTSSRPTATRGRAWRSPRSARPRATRAS